MAEEQNGQEKTEEATEHKLRKTREEGQTARSRDVTTAVSLLATLLLLKVTGGFIQDRLEESFRVSYVNFHHSELGVNDLGMILVHNLVLIMLIMVPLLIASVLVVVFALIPGGWVFSAKNFAPKLSKLDPIRGLGRMVGAQNWAELFKSLLKITALVIVAIWQISYALPQLLALQRTDIGTAIGGALSLVFNLAFSLLLVFVVFSLIDIPLQRYFFLKKQRMTKQERKDEQKSQEGSPEVKGRIRQLQRQLAHRQISKAIKDADAVIVNPLHYAVAVRYDPNKAEAPYVVAKGVDETALYIRKLAQAHDLEVVEVPPLARAIYYTTQVNQQIPTQLYAAVAHVLSYIVQLKAWRQGRRGKPRLPESIHIPEAFANRGR